jgi:adenosylcobinamide-GDP ribazoletransferase
MRLAVRSLRAAFAFLTRLPVGGHPYESSALAWAPAYFPVVGLVLGGLLAAAHRVLWPLGALADASLVIGLSLLLTGALHEDGLADTSDALGGAHDRERVLEILKDSRTGVFGACALVISLVGRIALLERLGRGAEWALPLVGCAARVTPVWQMLFLPYVSRVAAKSGELVRARLPHALLATAWPLVAAGAAAVGHVASTGQLVAMVVALTTVTGVTAWRYARRVGGLTGDFLGATEQLSELAAFAVLVYRP